MRDAPDRIRVKRVAQLVDAANLPKYAVAKRLHGVSSDDPKSFDRARGQVKRDLPAGRRALCAEGVLPWAAWPDGELPAEWWIADAFVKCVNDWMVAAYEAHSLALARRSANGVSPIVSFDRWPDKKAHKILSTGQ